MNLKPLTFIVLGLAPFIFGGAARAQMAMYTSSTAGTSSANHAVVAATGLGHRFYSAICTGNSAFTGGFCMVFDAAAQPADGAVVACTPGAQTSACVKFCAAIPTGPAASQGIAVAGGDISPVFNNGLVVVTSTGANCSTLTTSDGLSVFQSVTYN